MVAVEVSDEAVDESGVSARLRPWGYRPSLDGLRAIAVGLVLAFHVDLPIAAGGFVGVDLFFVLSGFVVTNVIWSEMATTGTLELRRFYARRMRRLTPAALLCVVGASLLFVLVAPLFDRLSFVADAQSALLYVANWHALAEATDYFEAGTAPSPFLHFWSLSIEEQFYVVFPLLMLGLWRASVRLGRPYLIAGGLAVLIGASVVAQLYWATRGTSMAYYRTDARLYQLLAGALAAVVLARSKRLRLAPSFGRVALLGLLGLFVAASNALDVSPSVRGLAATVCSLMVIVGLELSAKSSLDVVLARPTLVYFGGISYGIYLWHWPVILVLQRIFAVTPLTMLVLAGALAVSLAAASHRLIEDPVRRNRRLDKRPLSVVVTSLAVTVVTALVIVPPILESRRQPRVIAQTSDPSTLPVSAEADVPAGFDDPVPLDIDYESIRTFRAPFPECSARDVSTCIVRRGNGPHVLVVGDSIAQQYVPAFESIAASLDWTLSLNIAQGCSWQGGLLPRPDLSEEYQQRCAAQRDPWFDAALEELDPDVVVLTQLSRDEDRFASLMVPAAESLRDAPLSQINAVTIEDTLERLHEQGYAVVVVEPIPIPTGAKSPTECLSSARTVGECAFASSGPVDSEFAIRGAVNRLDGVSAIDLDDLICSADDICLPIVDDVVVWRDAGHLSHFYVEAVTEELQRRLVATGALDLS